MTLPTLKYALTLLFSFLLAWLPAAEFHESWVFKNDPQAIAQVLQQYNIDTASFQQALEDYGIKMSHAPSPYLPIHPADVDSLPYDMPSPNDALLVWEDEWTEIYIPPMLRVPHHLWVVLKAPKESLVDVSPEEALHLFQTCKKTISVLYHRFGIPSYVVSQSNLPQLGHFTNKVTLEIIPPRPDAIHEFDVHDKSGCRSYVLYRGYASSLCMPFNNEELLDMARQWSEGLQQVQDPLTDLPQMKECNMINIDKKNIYILEEFYNLLMLSGFSITTEFISDKSSHPKFSHPQSYLNLDRPCPFCNPEIRRNQHIIEWNGATVLYDHMPPQKEKHFLIIPSSHRNHFTDLTDSEVMAMHQAAVSLIKTMKQMYGDNDVKMFLQDGLVVGQSVFHPHWHLMLAPNPLALLMFVMSWQRLPYVNSEGFDHIRNVFAPLIFQHLTEISQGA